MVRVSQALALILAIMSRYVFKINRAFHFLNIIFAFVLLFIVLKFTVTNNSTSSTVFEKPGILSENLKTLTSYNYPAVQYFLLKLCTRFLLPMSTKGCLGFFLFCLDLKNVRNESVETRSFYIFINNPRSK